MRRRLAALCLLGGLGTLGACAVQAQSPVWAIHGTHNTVYLAESVHLLKASDARLPAAFDTAYAGARTIVMEIDLSNLDTEHMQAYMLEHAALKNGTTLRQAIGEQRFAKLGAEAARLGLPLEVLETLEPWAVALTLTDLEYLRLGFDPEQGVEKQIERRAREPVRSHRAASSRADPARRPHAARLPPPCSRGRPSRSARSAAASAGCAR